MSAQLSRPLAATDHPVPYLAQLWQDLTDTRYRRLTGSEFGQLKRLRSCLGVCTANVLSWSVRNWPRFSLQARIEAGLFTAPSVPHIGFLVKHFTVAVGLMRASAPALVAPLFPDRLSEAGRQERSGSASVHAISCTPRTSSTPGRAKEPVHVPHKLTAEELAEMLAGLKDA